PNVYPLSLHDALPIYTLRRVRGRLGGLMLLAGLSVMYLQATASTRARWIIAWMLRTVLGARPGVTCLGMMLDLYRRTAARAAWRSEEHTSELQSRSDL